MEGGKSLLFGLFYTFCACVGVLPGITAHKCLHRVNEHHLVVSNATSLYRGGVVTLRVSVKIGLLAVRVGGALVLLLRGNLLSFRVVHHL